ncbi:MAG: carbonate dehydratase [Gammaproteobacteria bacterium]|nr:carbonate dehydratase [Gammaproteobacteria bacterium]
MKLTDELIENNKRWAMSIKESRPDFFEKLSKQQAPKFLWIGCSDSRVPANEIVGLLPGELFVHRNVANIVVHTDFNCLSVLQYAVEQLNVEHVIVCGHYGCGGVKAVFSDDKHGLIDNWLQNIKDVYDRYQEKLNALSSEEQKVDLLCELNVVEQVSNVCRTTIVQDAWDRGQKLIVHGWIYGIRDGLIKDLNISVGGRQHLPPSYPPGV